jgi:hypothetical protein
MSNKKKTSAELALNKYNKLIKKYTTCCDKIQIIEPIQTSFEKLNSKVKFLNESNKSNKQIKTLEKNIILCLTHLINEHDDAFLEWLYFYNNSLFADYYLKYYNKYKVFVKINVSDSDN